jgi:hypothetical protein
MPGAGGDLTLGLCEDESQVAALADFEGGRGIDLFIATTPGAAWALEQRSIPFKAPEDFYSEAELLAHSEPFRREQRAWIAYIDGFLQRSVPVFEQIDFKPAACHMFYAKVMTDIFFMRVYVLRRLLEACRPARVACCYNREEPPFDPYFSIGQPRFSNMLGELAETWDVALVKVPLSAQVPGETGGGFKFLLWGALGRTLGAWRYHSGATLRKLKRDVCSQVVVMDDSYDVSAVAAAADRQGMSWEPWSSLLKRVTTGAQGVESSAAEVAGLWQGLINAPEFQRLFRYGDIGTWPVAEARMKFWWHTIVPETLQYYRAARDVLAREKPKAIVVPHPLNYPTAAILQAARGLAVPVVVYQHGGFMGNCEDTAVEFRELPHADYVFAYGEGAARYFSSYSESDRSSPRAVAIGSTRIDAIKGQQDQPLPRQYLDKDRPNILYISNPDKTNRYLKTNGFPVITFFRMQSALFRLFGEFPDLHLVYKMHPNNTISGDLARAHCHGCEVIGRELSIGELMWHVDAIVADAPSTGMLECVLTDKPMVVYADATLAPLLEPAKRMLEQRACVAESEDDFLRQTRDLLAGGDFSPLEHVDDSFRKAFATHADDGRSVDRALRFLQEIGD